MFTGGNSHTLRSYDNNTTKKQRLFQCERMFLVKQLAKHLVKKNNYVVVSTSESSSTPLQEVPAGLGRPKGLKHVLGVSSLGLSYLSYHLSPGDSEQCLDYAKH